MDYVALYRKWRPQDFTSLIGQEHIRVALSNALTNNRIAHAYLFCGPRGTGKTSTAKILAKAINCEKGPTPIPCNECTNCELINKGSSMDVFEIDAASNRGIDEIRELREKIRFLPVEGRKRVYIIDEVHMLTTEAFNALLKTLEEPPEHVLFILATTEPHKIPSTILSRCQRYDFKRLTVEDTVARLKTVAEGSGLKTDEDALKLIAAQADGGMRDALSLLDQCSVMTEDIIDSDVVRSLLGIVGRDNIRNIVTAIGEEKEHDVLTMLEKLLDDGKDIKQFISELSLYYRAVMLFKVAPDFADIYITDDAENLEKAAKLYTHERLVESSKRLHEATIELKTSIQERIAAEICLLELCHMKEKIKEADLLLRIEQLEKIVQGNDFTVRKVPLAEPLPIKQEVPKVIVPKETFAPKIEKKEIVPIDKVAEPPVQKEVGEKPVDPSQAQNIWEKLLQKLLSDNKRSLHACAIEGTATHLDERTLTVSFDKSFSCERMKKDDYRNVAEITLAEIIGRKILIEFVSNKKEKKAATTKIEKVNTSIEDKKETKKESLPDAVAKALEVFGGEVFNMKK